MKPGAIEWNNCLLQLFFRSFPNQVNLKLGLVEFWKIDRLSL